MNFASLQVGDVFRNLNNDILIKVNPRKVLCPAKQLTFDMPDMEEVRYLFSGGELEELSEFVNGLIKIEGK